MGQNAYLGFKGFHDGPNCQREVVSAAGGSGVRVVCLPCGCSADLEALGQRMTAEEASRHA